MMSATDLDVPQQWQFSQPVAYTQPPVTLGVEVATPQQWQLCQTTPLSMPLAMAPGDANWMHGTAATSQQHTLVMNTVPAPLQACPGNSITINNVATTVVAQFHPCAEARFDTGNVANGWQQWQPMSHAQPLEQTMQPQVIVLIPVCSPETSMPNLQPWSQVAPGAPMRSRELLPTYVPQSFAQTPASHLQFASNSVNCAPTDDHQSHSQFAWQTTAVPDCLDCQCSANNMHEEAVAQHAQAEYEEHVEVVELAKHVDIEKVDHLTDSGNVGDMPVTQCDTKSYASSETSTAVSRSARRRRGRRAAKAKVCKTSTAIVETPAPEELLLTAETKEGLIQQLAAGGHGVRQAVSSLRGSVLRLSLEPFGCRVIQMALDVASASQKEDLVAELHDHVRLAISSPHANFVIQKVIEVLPIKSASFIAEELVTVAAEVARHRFGCRILSRLVEHHLCGNGSAPSADLLIDEVLLETDQLIHHNFARHVLELILEHGTENHKEKIAKSIRNNIHHYAKNRFASYVVEKALLFCPTQDTHAMVSGLLDDSERFLMLAVHECGTHVVKAIIKMHGDCAAKAKELLLREVNRLESSKFGKRLLDELYR